MSPLDFHLKSQTDWCPPSRTHPGHLSLPFFIPSFLSSFHLPSTVIFKISYQHLKRHQVSHGWGEGEHLDFWLLLENQGFWKLETTFFFFSWKQTGRELHLQAVSQHLQLPRSSPSLGWPDPETMWHLLLNLSSACYLTWPYRP